MRLHPCVAALLAAFSSAAVLASPSGVVISQVYGGGGNSGATLKNDFIELYNAGSAPVSLAGWSLQYTSASGPSTGTSWQVTPLGNVQLAPGQYYLVQQAQGSGGSLALPTPDAVGSIAMSGSAGKVALVRTTTALTVANPTANIEDLVGYGSANFFEGSAAAPTLGNTTAALRAASGCTDTDANAADFSAGTPVPRNTASPVGSCVVVAPPSVAIPAIQGPGSLSPWADQRVRTSGVVTLLTNNGFFLQDPVGDGDSATSDGLFVYLGSAPTVSIGQLVQLDGTVKEFNVGAASNADTAAHTVTELTSVSGLTVLASGQSITPVDVTLPEGVNDDLERFEGMLVRLVGPLTVSQNYFLGRYGQLTLSAGGRLEVPTNRFRPGSAEALALADANARRRILLDDGSTQQNPNPTPYLAADHTLRAGDTTGEVIGVVDYGLATSSNTGLGDYRIHPAAPVSFSRDNPRSSAPAALRGNLRVASFNVLNYFTTFQNGETADGQTGQGCSLGGVVSAANCRGANNAEEFQRQRAKIVEALAAINADAVGLMEIQNNGGLAAQNLVDGLNARLGAGTYAVVPEPAQGTGSDAIRVAMIYKPAVLTPVGPALSDPDAVNNRPPLAQSFRLANTQQFNLVVNHLKSKSSCPAAGDSDYAGNFDAGDGQGCWNGRRVEQARRLAQWVQDTVQASSGSERSLLIGDFNAYAKEDPIQALLDQAWVDQIGRFSGFGYSYVFDGAAGRLDHALATPALGALVTSAEEWHINADEPSVIDYNTEFKQPACAGCGPDYYEATAWRSSDHDPAVVGLYLLNPVQGRDGKFDKLQGTPGDDLIVGGTGGDQLTGHGGADVFQLRNLADGLDVVLDFSPAEDRLDLRGVLAELGYAGADPVADGVIRLRDSASGVLVQVRKVLGGPAVFRTVARLAGLTAAQLQPARDLIVQTVAVTALKH